jgi:hypothetical protein
MNGLQRAAASHVRRPQIVPSDEQGENQGIEVGQRLRLEPQSAPMLRGDPVTMAWWLTGDDHPERMRTFIQSLMPLARDNLDSFARFKRKVVIFDFQDQLTFENEEELARTNVGMSNLTRACGHEFFDNAEVWRLDEVPAIAIRSVRSTPFVVFG